MGEIKVPTPLLHVSLLSNILLVIIGFDAGWSRFYPLINGVNPFLGNYLFGIIELPIKSQSRSLWFIRTSILQSSRCLGTISLVSS
jgi:hypothetical protein